jgi:hypothetical protein
LTIDDVIYQVSQALQNVWEPIWAWIYVVDNWIPGVVIFVVVMTVLRIVARIIRD